MALGAKALPPSENLAGQARTAKVPDHYDRRQIKKGGWPRGVGPAALLYFSRAAAFYFAAAAASMNFAPFGAPQPVTLSHPLDIVSDESVPKLRSKSSPP